MEKITIDINCDIGEGMDNEKGLLPLISSCNIACGGHSGNEASMIETVRMAQFYNVKIGAHPSYPDKENFGRVSIPILPEDLIHSIQQQVRNLEAVITEENVELHHIKPHGALYNDIAENKALSKIFLKAISKYKTDVFLYVPYASEIEKEAVRQGFRIRYEAFADRNYASDLSLVPRKDPHALISDKEKVLHHIVVMVRRNIVRTLTGRETKILADTFCMHSDTPLAFEIVSYLTEELPKHNIYITK